MLFPVSPNTVAESNLLLRSLWVQIRQEFGKLAWQFCPSRHRDRSTIYFGWADVGTQNTLRVGVTYARRGIVNHILFEGATEHADRLRACVANAVVAVDSPVEFSFSAPVQVSLNYRVANTDGEVVSLSSTRAGRAHIDIRRIQAFDELDARAEFERRLRLVLDTLSFLTNARFSIISSDEVDIPTSAFIDGNRAPLSTLPVDWIDGHPLIDDFLVIDETGIKLLEVQASASIAEDLSLLADAAHHFHNGLAAEALRFDSTLVGAHAEQAIVFYISALEVASLVGAPAPSTCSKCGQPQHRISARVVDFVDSILGGAVASLIKSLYASRSAYLHRGLLLSTRSYVGATFPQLDPTSSTGVQAPLTVAPLLNLREFTSYCLRHVAFSNAAKSAATQISVTEYDGK